MWVQLRQGYSRRGGRGIVVRKCLDVEPCCRQRGLCAPGTGRAPWAGCRRAGVLLDVLSVQKAFRLKRRNAPCANAAAVLVLAAALPRPGSGGTQLPMAATAPPDALPAQQCISIIFCVSHLCKRARGPLNLFQRYSPCRHVVGTAQPLRQQPALGLLWKSEPCSSPDT